MNKIGIIISLSFCLIMTSLKAQVKSGLVLFQMDVVATDSSMVKSALRTNGTRMAIYFSPKKNRVDLFVGKMMKIITVNNFEKDTSLMLTSSQMGNYAIQATVEQIASKEEKTDSTLRVVLFDDTKEIAGETCKKAIVYKADGREITHWYTENIIVEISDKQFQEESVPGFSLEIEGSSNGLHTRLYALKIDTSFESTEEIIFSTAFPPGFQHMTWEQYQASKSKLRK